MYYTKENFQNFSSIGWFKKFHKGLDRIQRKSDEGQVRYNIIKMAHGKEKFDIIVIGSRGRSSAKEMFFGSTSNYVIHTSKIPVVIIK